MKAIGFRAFPDSVSYVILEGTLLDPKVIKYDNVKIPKNVISKDYESLSWIRKEIIEILNINKVDKCSIKTTENFPAKKNSKRIEIEGVIKEVAFSNSSFKVISRIKSQIKRDCNFKKKASDLYELLNVSILQPLNNSIYNDATLTALADLN
jgi:hypothetical protein